MVSPIMESSIIGANLTWAKPASQCGRSSSESPVSADRNRFQVRPLQFVVELRQQSLLHLVPLARPQFQRALRFLKYSGGLRRYGSISALDHSQCGSNTRARVLRSEEHT